MNMKRSIILFVVAAILCLLVYADYARKPAKETGGKSTTGRVMVTKALDGVSPDTVSKIEVVPPGKKDAVVLVKDAGEWKVKSGDRLYRITQYKADQIFGSIESGDEKEKEKKVELKGPFTLELQARKAESHADFDLTAEKATDVKFFDSKDKLIAEVLLGKSGTDWQSTYIRMPGKDEVYLAPVRLTDNFSGDDVNAWRDKRLFPDVKAENIYKIEVDDRANTRTFALAKLPQPGGPDAWWVTEPFDHVARASTADSMTRTLANLNAAEFAKPEDVAKADFDHPTLIARIHVKDTATTPVLTVGAESETSKGRFFAKTNLDDEVYMIYKPYALAADPATLKETPTPTPSPSPTEAPVETEAPADTEGQAPADTSAPAPTEEHSSSPAEEAAPIVPAAAPAVEPAAGPAPTPQNP